MSNFEQKLPVIPIEINEANRQFWKKQQAEMDTQLANSAIVQTAIEGLEDEAATQVTIQNASSFESLLAKAAGMYERFKKHMARQGGSAPKVDALSLFIENIVRKSPQISEKELLSRLTAHQPIPPILEVTENNIAIENHNGSEKQVSVKGVKDRLSRIKKKLRSH